MPPKMPPKMPPNRHGGVPMKIDGMKLDPKVIKRIFSYMSKKHIALLGCVVVCIFLSSIANVYS